jgi:crossover junction endodeoxyribonuclease RuvC
VECGVIRTTARAPLPERLKDIFEGVSEVIGRHGPAALAVEGVFFAKNARTAVVLGHARGAVLLAAALRGLEVAEYPPAEVKSAVAGIGSATKDQVGFMVQRLLKLREIPKPHDAADGVAVALCHCFRGYGPGAKIPLEVAVRLYDQSGGKR